MKSTTIEEVVKARRDLEKRLLVDIQQFERDTCVQVGHIELQHVQRMGERTDALIDVEIRLEFPR